MRIQKLKMRQFLALLAAVVLLANVMPPRAVAVSTPTDIQTDGAEAPDFHAYIDFDGQGYAVMGEAEFPADTCRVQNLYSLDGVNYEFCDREWLIPAPVESSVTSGSAIKVPQICLRKYETPLRDYLDGTLDRFYLKLLITREDGTAYESKAALIERNKEPQVIPEGTSLVANFSPSMKVKGPSYFYGKYQLTVPSNATEEDITAYLPDRLPVRIWVGNMHCDLDCPVVWKPIALSGLTPGESVVIENAAEPVAVPVGTLLDTPLGIFQLSESLLLGEMPWSANEVQLILNVISPGESPAGVLDIDREMLKMSFTKKPTGATSIQAYILSEGETTWTEIQGLSLLDAVNSQPSTESSGYATIFDKDTEPFRSYLEASAAGSTPVPFFVGLKIEGGVYDGQQLVLSWPGDYEALPNLPSIDGGSGGNENNTGSGNKDDSTEGGQRPDLPQQPEDTTNQPSGGNTQNPGNTQSPGNNENTQNPDGTQQSENDENTRNPSDIKPPGNMENKPEGDKSIKALRGSTQPAGNAESQPGSIPQPESPADDKSMRDVNNPPLPDSQQQPKLPQGSETPQEPEFSKQPESQQQSELPQQPELLQQAGFSQQADVGTVNRSISIPAIAGTIGIAGIGTAIWGRKALTHLFGKIRSILHGIIK